MELTNSQSSSVEKLMKAFSNRESNKRVYFKAPTGSGKTFMASEFISRALFECFATGKKAMVVVATISNAELPKQFTKKLNQYKGYHEFNSYDVEHINSPSNTKSVKVEDVKDFDVRENLVYVFGKASFGKNTLFYQNGTLNSFFQRAKLEGVEIIYIRDEAHIGSGKTMSKSEQENFESEMYNNSSFIIEMTATPKEKDNLIEMTKKDMENDGRWLLKSKELKTNLKGDLSNEEIIDDAINTFKLSKKEYSDLGENINPAMLIQVMNESEISKELQEDFENSLKILEDKLTKAGLTYLKYFGKENQVINTTAPPTLEYCSRNDSIIDVVIFKVGPATGWDIPRANMLLQLRNVSSESLNLQTLGRIMRNPLKALEYNSITDKYYLYSNFQKPTRDAATYRLKDKFEEQKLLVGKVDENSKAFKLHADNFNQELSSFLSSSDFINAVKDLNPEKDIIYNRITYGNAKVNNSIPNILKLYIYNFKKEKEYENIIDIKNIEDIISNLSSKVNVNVELVKYVLWNFMPNIKELKNKNSEWIHYEDPYSVSDASDLMKTYNIWVDNNRDKVAFSNSDFGDKYGYQLISNEEDVQWLDSTPELKFYEKFRDSISSSQKENIKFFSKMPTLGSKISFDYYSREEGAIKKSFMDFAIVYKERIIMVEVKSKENDYNEEKTNNLKQAYKMYMEKEGGKNLSLVVYEYGKTSDDLSAFIEGEWKTKQSFRDVFDKLLN